MAVVGSNAPLPEGKPTRQWDAWTREEEENFFGALRQVGKNFEKITSRVQSKNKDQVRHYYYRVIKRMNRILAPTLILDAKNSTYVNSAMLRWWSLLEKHSCSASKLRLKPRRFKTFVTALEHQLLKDHKKVRAKKPAPAAATTSRRPTANAEITAVIPMVLPGLVTGGSGARKASEDDLQTLQTVGVGQRTAVKRKAASSELRNLCTKDEARRLARPRKRATDCILSKTSYAKWEKAASVGVSLMAEAAEQLERESAAEEMLPSSEASKIHSTTGVNHNNTAVNPGQISPGAPLVFTELELSDKAKQLPFEPRVETTGLGGVPVSSGISAVTCASQAVCVSSTVSMLSSTSQQAMSNIYEGVSGGLVIIPDLCAQVKAKSLALENKWCNCSTLRCKGLGEGTNGMTGAKLKLQLFPFDDYIRKALEQDGHNPHLELTFKARKSISSVLHHLVQKWGHSTVASGDLCLFPFNTQWSSVSACQSWSFQDLTVSAADVHAALGNPVVFRLRYAWLSSRILQSSAALLQQRQLGAPHSRSVQGACYPTLGSDDTAHQKPVLSQTSLTASVCVGNSTGTSIGQWKPSEETEPLEVACRLEDWRHVVQCVVPVDTILGLDMQGAVQCEESIQRSCVCPVLESEHIVVGKLSSNVAPVAPVEFQREEESVLPAVDLASFAERRLENFDRFNCKEFENSSQISGCAWLCESNDGFAQQLWNYEDTLRSNSAVSFAQMDWVDSLTNISVSDLLGEASRAVFSSSLGSLHPTPEQSQLTCLDFFDIATAGQELPPSGPSLIPSDHPSAAIFGGEDTCDAFSFQRLDRNSKETVNSLSEEILGHSLGLDVPLADFRNMAYWKEGDSLGTYDMAQTSQHCQTQDLLFDGEASIGLGGLIEALAQGSLDEFQPRAIGHDVESRDLGQEIRLCSKVSGQTRTGNAEVCPELPVKDAICSVLSARFGEAPRIVDLQNGNNELSQLNERTPEATLPKITLPSQDMESLKPSRTVDVRVSRKKEHHPPQKTFKLPGQYNSGRTLKLQG